MIYSLIALAICAVILLILYLRERALAQRVFEVNQLTADENAFIEQENRELRSTNDQLQAEWQELKQKHDEKLVELNGLKEQVKVQQNICETYTKTAQTMEKDAQERAQRSYEAAAASLAEVYDKRKQELDEQYQKDSQLLFAKLEEEKAKLKDIEDKQFAYIKAKQREEEIEKEKDYYRLVLSSTDIEEVALLRELQIKFSRKEAIDKLIWESYYKAAYDLLMSHLFNGTEKICGIYKITNLENGQAYIGQSVDIRERFRQHIKSALTSGPTTNKLYQQMKKFGPHNFSFEVLETIPRDKLNEREVYWIDFYKTKELGMNGTKGGS